MPQMRRRRRRPNWPLRWWTFLVTLGFGFFFSIQTYRAIHGVGSRVYGIDWGLAMLSASLDSVVGFWFFVVGATIGSFLNVVAYRVPRGRGVGGNSRCPYCATPVDSLDNLPIFGWLKLRGRCRTCRLPISPQYPLVEAFVAVAFFVVYVSEVLSGGANLPSGSIAAAATLMQVQLSLSLVLRVITYLVLLSGLIAAALIAVQKQRVPLKLYVYCTAPWLVATLAWPPSVIVPWRAAKVGATADGRIDALITQVAGAAATLVIARLLAPVLYPGFDRRLVDERPSTCGARQFFGAMTAVGTLIGWQSATAYGWILMAIALAGAVMLRAFAERFQLFDLTVWVGVALLIFRAFWRPLFHGEILPTSIAEVMRHVLAALMLVPCAWLLRWLADSSPVLQRGSNQA
ncbi:MAG: hypothetical protein KatS3mg111_0437 [Pirellulaceae bacterium]|nr:MAG: hypothetical protein KatS3mg111_0437 [Pirellulaceae bacterium]